MITNNLTIGEFCRWLEAGEPFSFSKWGDGEWNAIFQDTRSRNNCDLHEYFPAMGQRLMEVLESRPMYNIGLQNLAYTQRREQIDELTQRHDLTWCAADILHKASIKGKLHHLFNALADRDVILVGPEHLLPLSGREQWRQIVIPSKNCFLDYENIKHKIGQLIHPEVVMLYSCSMMSGILVDDFDGRATQIDTGSVLDPYAGKNTRRYHEGLKL